MAPKAEKFVERAEALLVGTPGSIIRAWEEKEGKKLQVKDSLAGNMSKANREEAQRLIGEEVKQLFLLCSEYVRTGEMLRTLTGLNERDRGEMTQWKDIIASFPVSVQKEPIGKRALTKQLAIQLIQETQEKTRSYIIGLSEDVQVLAGYKEKFERMASYMKEIVAHEKDKRALDDLKALSVSVKSQFSSVGKTATFAGTEEIQELSAQEATLLARIEAFEKRAWQEDTLAEMMAARENVLNQRAYKKYGYIMTESREKLVEEIVPLLHLGKPCLIYGPAGTGKTEICRYISVREFGMPPFEITMNEEFHVRVLEARQTFADGKAGWELSPFLQALKDGQPIVLNELDKMSREVQNHLRGIFGQGIGSVYVVPQTGERITIKSPIMSTANMEAEDVQKLSDPFLRRLTGGRVRLGIMDEGKKNKKDGTPEAPELREFIKTHILSTSSYFPYAWRRDVHQPQLDAFVTGLRLIGDNYTLSKTLTASQARAQSGYIAIKRMYINPENIRDIIIDWKMQDFDSIERALIRSFFKKNRADQGDLREDVRNMARIFMMQGLFAGTYTADEIAALGFTEEEFEKERAESQ
jgi:hypothetical protein